VTEPGNVRADEEAQFKFKGLKKMLEKGRGNAEK
jgi:hypothetical protein